MFNLTYREAARILDPETSRGEVFALRKIYGEAEAMMRVEEATRMAAEVLREKAEKENEI